MVDLCPCSKLREAQEKEVRAAVEKCAEEVSQPVLHVFCHGLSNLTSHHTMHHTTTPATLSGHLHMQQEMQRMRMAAETGNTTRRQELTAIGCVQCNIRVTGHTCVYTVQWHTS